MTDDRDFEAFLTREVGEFNRPPDTVPREEMWAVIAQARAERRAPGHAVVPRRGGLRFAPWIGMAATLVIGVGLGRYALLRDAGSPSANPDSAVVLASDSPMVAPSLIATPAPIGATDGPTRRNVVPMRAASIVATTTDREAATRVDPNSTSYQIAARAHLTRAEALVAVVSEMPADAMMDSLLGRWARDVLSNTRLLLDSPAGEDPVRRGLLEDLETLLVQMVQRSGRAAEERAMIDRTLQKTQLLTRLRSRVTGT